MAIAKLENLQLKTTPETLKLFEEIFEESGCTTKGQFIEAILEAYLNPPKGKNIEWKDLFDLGRSRDGT